MRFATAILISILTLMGFRPAPLEAQRSAADPSMEWLQARLPNRVLITNDNGIDDPKIVALARAFARYAETWVVAPATDQSGGGAHVTLVRRGSVEVEERDLGPGIRAFAVHGYPADAVVVALAGIMKDGLPDLVVSGINGGPNLGGGWMFSGTVGAARVAALAGLPAIAVSGLLDDELPGAPEAAAEWVVRLAASDMVRELEPLEYLTVSFPPNTPRGVRGVRVTGRAPLAAIPRIALAGDGAWHVAGTDSTHLPVPDDSDEAAWDQGFIAIVPMRAEEIDEAALRRWQRAVDGLPEWTYEGTDGGF